MGLLALLLWPARGLFAYTASALALYLLVVSVSLNKLAMDRRNVFLPFGGQKTARPAAALHALLDLQVLGERGEPIHHARHQLAETEGVSAREQEHTPQVDAVLSITGVDVVLPIVPSFAHHVVGNTQ